jgi:hypothetical protein
MKGRQELEQMQGQKELAQKEEQTPRQMKGRQELEREQKEEQTPWQKEQAQKEEQEHEQSCHHPPHR